MQNTVVFAVLVTCLKVLIPFKTRCENLDLVWVLWTLNKCENGIKNCCLLGFYGRKEKKWPFSLS